MAEIEITLPTVQYGNVKVRATPEELGLDSVGDAAALGVATAVYLTTFSLGFKRGAAIDVDIDDSMAHAGSGPYKAVSAPVAAPQEAAPGDPQAAADRLADGRLPRTVDEYNEMAKQVIENELGPTTDVTEAPWDKPAVDVKPKPWENGTTATKAVDLGDDW